MPVNVCIYLYVCPLADNFLKVVLHPLPPPALPWWSRCQSWDWVVAGVLLLGPVHLQQLKDRPDCPQHAIAQDQPLPSSEKKEYIFCNKLFSHKKKSLQITFTVKSSKGHGCPVASVWSTVDLLPDSWSCTLFPRPADWCVVYRSKQLHFHVMVWWMWQKRGVRFWLRGAPNYLCWRNLIA